MGVYPRINMLIYYITRTLRCQAVRDNSTLHIAPRRSLRASVALSPSMQSRRSARSKLAFGFAPPFYSANTSGLTSAPIPQRVHDEARNAVHAEYIATLPVPARHLGQQQPTAIRQSSRGCEYFPCMLIMGSCSAGGLYCSRVGAEPVTATMRPLPCAQKRPCRCGRGALSTFIIR